MCWGANVPQALFLSAETLRLGISTFRLKRAQAKKIHKGQILDSTNFTQIQCKEKICNLGQNSCLDRKADKQQYSNRNSTNTMVATIALIFILRQIQKKQYLWVNMKRKEQQIQILHWMGLWERNIWTNVSQAALSHAERRWRQYTASSSLLSLGQSRLT